MLTPERREWKAACKYAVSVFGREWDTAPLSNWKNEMRNVLRPFDISEEMLMQLVNNVDQLFATDDGLRTKSHFMLIERELDAPGLSSVVQRQLGERDDGVRIVAEREFTHLRACRLVTDVAGSVDSLIDEVRDAQRRGVDIEETTFARFLRVAVDAGVRFVIGHGDDHEKPFFTRILKMWRWRLCQLKEGSVVSAFGLQGHPWESPNSMSLRGPLPPAWLTFADRR